MTELKPGPEELLVAVDFSPCSLRALDAALTWRIEDLGLAEADAALSRMRGRAEVELARLVAERGAERVETMIVVGTPFLEIVKIAHDLECDLIVIGIHGRDAGFKQLLFGGTAEKVLRGANRPVLCLP
jgi:nucleotide-binding universal stress UspA family protein